jgi:ZIP family zinc transporter
VATDLLVLFAAGWATALATGLGAIPVFLLGTRARTLQPALVGMAAGLMTVASIVGLLLPAIDEGGSAGELALGIGAGVAFLLVARHIIERRKPTLGEFGGRDVRRSLLVLLVLFVHSLPEGLAIGTAYASETAGLGLFVIVAIALHNVPEGTASAVPMQEAGFSPFHQFWAAVATSVPQPFGAVAAYLLVEQIDGLLPVSFAFAAGAMLALVVVDLIPDAFSRRTWRGATVGALAGAGVMLALGAVLGTA